MKRILSVTIATAAVLALLIPGLAAPVQRQFTLPDIPNPKVDSHATGEGARYGGVFVTSQISDPRTFNYIVAQETSSTIPLSLVFNGLVDQNFVTGEIEPDLAESWSLSPDRRTWTFRLRRGVKWHDGQPFTAADVDFTFRAIFTEGVQTSYKDTLTYEGQPLRWRVVDPFTVQFTTPKAVGIFLRQIGVPILPKHKLEAALARGGAEFNRTWSVATPPREIVGTGAFVMQRYTPGQRMEFVRWSGYYKVDQRGNRLPYLTRRVILVVPNLDAARLRFLAGETDIYAARPREFAEFKAREREGNYTLYDGPETFSSEFVALNMNPRGVQPPKVTWFQDVRFRRALNHAIDRNAIAQQVYAGRATPAWGPVSSGHPLYYNPRLTQYPYDINRAQQLLAEAGYRRDGTGPLRDPQGNTVAFVLATNAENADRVAIGNIVRQDWQRLGVQVTFAPEAFNSLVGKLVGSFNWDAIIIGLTGGIEPGTGRNVWLCSGSLHLWWPRQERCATPWEEEIDRLFEQVAEETDQTRRRQLYFRWQELVAQNVPLMYFTHPKTQPAVRNTLGNIKIGLQGAVSPSEILYYKTPVRR
jgi:peptide/nickel transport system substrate-binding protein